MRNEIIDEIVFRNHEMTHIQLREGLIKKIEKKVGNFQLGGGGGSEEGNFPTFFFLVFFSF